MAGSVKVFLVLLLIGYTHGQQQGSDEVDCVSREEFDRVNAKLLGIKDELDLWQKTTIDILTTHVLDNQELPDDYSCNTTAELADSLSQLQTDVQGIQNQVSTINSNSYMLIWQYQRQQELLQRAVQNTSITQLVLEMCENSALQYTDLEEQLGEITQELSEIKATQHTSLTQLSDEVQEIHDNSALQHTNLEEQLGGITQEQVNQHTSLTELSDQVQEIRDNSALQHTNLEEKLREITRELSEIKANHPVSGTFQNPAPSCHYTNLPAGRRSGYYYIQSSSAGNGAIRVYCDMTRRCCCSRGGWMRVAQIDMTNPFQSCPSGFRLRTAPKRACGRHGSGCVSTTFQVHGVQYSRVCGRVIAYQHSSPDAFAPYYLNRHRTIDDLYVDGVSLTHGQNPRKHIWTFAAAVDETQHSEAVCPCTKTDTAYTGAVPPFIGQDYFCDTGSRNQFHYIFYSNNPLWDGAGCGTTSTCCSFNNPPWFCKQLPQPTTDDIELRLCGDESLSNEDIGMEIVELYVL